MVGETMKRRWSELHSLGQLFILIIGFLMLITVSFGLGMAFLPSDQHGGQAFASVLWRRIFSKTPKFVVGDCVAVDIRDYERWQKPTVTRIVEVGRKHYREEYWSRQSRTWNVENPRSLSFVDARRFYIKVPCPT